jgi:hypothetical protein
MNNKATMDNQDAMEVDIAEVPMQVEPKHSNSKGFFHGKGISALASAAGAAVGIISRNKNENQKNMTSNPQIKYSALMASSEVHSPVSKLNNFNVQDLSNNSSITDYAPQMPLSPLHIPEILEIIFGFLETPLNTGSDPMEPLDFVKVDSIKYTITRPKLHSCILVNKLWNSCATKILWRHIKVGSDIGCRRLARTLLHTSISKEPNEKQKVTNGL